MRVNKITYAVAQCVKMRHFPLTDNDSSNCSCDRNDRNAKIPNYIAKGISGHTQNAIAHREFTEKSNNCMFYSENGRSHEQENHSIDSISKSWFILFSFMTMPMRIGSRFCSNENSFLITAFVKCLFWPLFFSCTFKMEEFV